MLKLTFNCIAMAESQTSSGGASRLDRPRAEARCTPERGDRCARDDPGPGHPAPRRWDPALPRQPRSEADIPAEIQALGRRSAAGERMPRSARKSTRLARWRGLAPGPRLGALRAALERSAAVEHLHAAHGPGTVCCDDALGGGALGSVGRSSGVGQWPASGVPRGPRPTAFSMAMDSPAPTKGLLRRRDRRLRESASHAAPA